RVKVVKNKVAPPFREAEFDVIFNEGISKVGEIVDIGADKGIIDKAGSWYSFKGERIGQGREGAKTFLRQHPEISAEITRLIFSTLGIEPEQNTSQIRQASDDASASKTPKIEAEAKESPIKSVPKRKAESNTAAAANA
ncbi:MAG: DNA recombination/repair protein RecA, partial [Proteobacteria bacterium]